MKIAILSDIHGNYVALEKCVEHALAEGVKTFVFLGDYVGELGYPQKTMNIIFNLKENYDCYFIKGNKENYWINYQKDHEEGWKEYDSTTGSLFYTYKNLTNKDLEFFNELSYVDNICINGYPAITICHGSPNKVNEKLLPDNEKTFSIIEQNDNDLVLCGHTHVQNIIKHKGKVVINPGAVGVSLHGEGKAQFAILTGENGDWKHDFVNLDYDVHQVIQDLETSGLNEKAPCWCAVTKHLLKTGEVSHGSVLGKAMMFCEQEMGKCDWPDVPEKYWKMAVDEMISNN